MKHVLVTSTYEYRTQMLSSKRRGDYERSRKHMRVLMQSVTANLILIDRERWKKQQQQTNTFHLSEGGYRKLEKLELFTSSCKTSTNGRRKVLNGTSREITHKRR